MNKFITALIALTLITSPVFAIEGGMKPLTEAACGPATAVLNTLDKKYGEKLIRTVGDRNLFGNTSTGTFTVLVLVGGAACVVSAGKGWVETDKVPGLDEGAKFDVPA